MVYQVNLNAVISNGYYIFTVTILRDLFSYNINMFQHYVKEYDILVSDSQNLEDKYTVGIILFPSF